MAQLAGFTQNLTAQQIVRAADREAGSPALYLNTAGSEDLTAVAYVKLQAILDQLAMTGDWPFRQDSLTIQIAGRTTSLPSDYWNASFTDLFWIHPTSGNRTPIRLVDPQTFHTQIVPSDQSDAPPTSACVQKNQGAANGGTPSGVLMVNPVWTTHYLLELHYSPLATALAAISTKPWFPYALYLIKAVAVELFIDQDDQRAVGVAQERDRLYREIQGAMADPGARPRAIRFSPDCFHPPRII